MRDPPIQSTSHHFHHCLLIVVMNGSLSPEAGDISDAVSVIKPLVFYDGNVELRAGDCAVKLHWAVLRAVSTGFEQMHEANPRPAGGIPVIRLNDPQDDLLLYACAVYNRNRYVHLKCLIRSSPLAQRAY